MTLLDYIGLYGATAHALSGLVGTEIVIVDEKYPLDVMRISRIDLHESIDANGAREWQTLYVDFKAHKGVAIPSELFDKVDLLTGNQFAV